jgi:hypothetical protein
VGDFFKDIVESRNEIECGDCAKQYPRAMVAGRKGLRYLARFRRRLHSIHVFVPHI